MKKGTVTIAGANFVLYACTWFQYLYTNTLFTRVCMVRSKLYVLTAFIQTLSDWPSLLVTAVLRGTVQYGMARFTQCETKYRSVLSTPTPITTPSMLGFSMTCQQCRDKP